MRNGLMILSLMLAMFLGNVAIAGPRCQSDCPTTVQPIRNTLRGAYTQKWIIIRGDMCSYCSELRCFLNKVNIRKCGLFPHPDLRAELENEQLQVDARLHIGRPVRVRQETDPSDEELALRVGQRRVFIVEELSQEPIPLRVKHDRLLEIFQRRGQELQQ